MTKYIKTRKKQKSSNTRELEIALKMLSVTDGSSINSVNTTEKELAAVYLYAMGCTVSTEKTSYSLLNDQTDTENIENENIDESRKFSQLKAGKTSATDKFANTSDPFYELDDDLPERVKAVKSSIAASSAPDLTKLAISLANMK
tara:strand:- start:897 stop:1331 length:435 start_codon:yes stop_codon:yes gene_type:complete